MNTVVFNYCGILTLPKAGKTAVYYGILPLHFVKFKYSYDPNNFCIIVSECPCVQSLYLAQTNTPAYYNIVLITPAKSFVEKAPGACTIKHFTAVIVFRTVTS